MVMSERGEKEREREEKDGILKKKIDDALTSSHLETPVSRMQGTCVFRGRLVGDFLG